MRRRRADAGPGKRRRRSGRIMRDYYEVLGVAPTADAATIKRAYRKLALRHHPDRNEGSGEAGARFREATEAFQVLADARTRKLYDILGPAAYAATGAALSEADDDAIAHALSLVLDHAGAGVGDAAAAGGPWAEGGEPGAAGRAADGAPRVELRITLAEAARGTRSRLAVPCFDCAGTGRGPGRVRCEACGGTGRTRRARRGLLAASAPTAACEACGGSGERPAPCGTCHGSGRDLSGRGFDVDVPAGVGDGDAFQVVETVRAGPGGIVRGVIHVVIRVADDRRFVRDGADLLHRLSVEPAAARVGGRFTVPTLEGEVVVEIPAGVETGHLVRLPGEGLPDRRWGGRGDEIVRVVVETALPSGRVASMATSYGANAAESAERAEVERRTAASSRRVAALLGLVLTVAAALAYLLGWAA